MNYPSTNYVWIWHFYFMLTAFNCDRFYNLLDYNGRNSDRGVHRVGFYLLFVFMFCDVVIIIIISSSSNRKRRAISSPDKDMWQVVLWRWITLRLLTRVSARRRLSCWQVKLIPGADPPAQAGKNQSTDVDFYRNYPSRYCFGSNYSSRSIYK